MTTRKTTAEIRRIPLISAMGLAALATGHAPATQAGATFKIDDTKWVSVGAGIAADAGDFRGTTVDVLMEKVLPNSGVVTLNGEYKNYGISSGYSQASRDAGGGFAMFEGNAYDVSGMYLFPQKIGIGQIQPYVRYVNVMPNGSTNRNNHEGGVNYIIDGHNARVSLSWEYGDLMSKGLNYTSTAAGDNANAVKLGFQWQI